MNGEDKIEIIPVGQLSPIQADTHQRGETESLIKLMGS
jgi:hypothetical protein